MFREVEKLEDLEQISSYSISRNDPYHKVMGYYEFDTWLGFIDYSLIYDKSELNYIFVKEEVRGKDIGSKLMEYWLEVCQKNNIAVQTLEVNEMNELAISLYQKYGFTCVATRNNYYGKNNGYLMMRGRE